MHVQAGDNSLLSISLSSRRFAGHRYNASFCRAINTGEFPGIIPDNKIDFGASSSPSDHTYPGTKPRSPPTPAGLVPALTKEKGGSPGKVRV